jgi:hypothetical protein
LRRATQRAVLLGMRRAVGNVERVSRSKVSRFAAAGQPHLSLGHSASASNGCVCVSTTCAGAQRRSTTSSAPALRERARKLSNDPTADAEFSFMASDVAQCGGGGKVDGVASRDRSWYVRKPGRACVLLVRDFLHPLDDLAVQVLLDGKVVHSGRVTAANGDAGLGPLSSSLLR